MELEPSIRTHPLMYEMDWARKVFVRMEKDIESIQADTSRIIKELEALLQKAKIVAENLSYYQIGVRPDSPQEEVHQQPQRARQENWGSRRFSTSSEEEERREKRERFPRERHPRVTPPEPSNEGQGRKKQGKRYRKRKEGPRKERILSPEPIQDQWDWSRVATGPTRW